MKGPSSAAFARAPRAVVALALTFGCLGSAFAQGDPRRAVDGLEPAERGSEWFANESLDLRGRFRPSLGYAVSLAHRPRVVPVADGAPERAPVKDLAYLHIGGSLTLIDRIRLSFDFPFQVYAGGESAVENGTTVPAPPKEGGIGDLRLGADVRVFGHHRRGITGAIGLQAWAPTGQQSQWSSDGTFRVRPRAMALVGERPVRRRGAARILRARELAAHGVGGDRRADREGHGGGPGDLRLDGGPRPLREADHSHRSCARRALARGRNGAHRDRVRRRADRGNLGARLEGHLRNRVGAGNSQGSSPSSHAGVRGALAESDEDRDGVPDASDACPRAPGIKTDDPRTSGCPPDADDDGVDDLVDACPTVRGLATSDPQTNGCPDRDRDKDGVPDDLDACPDDRGAPDPDPRRSGCPKAFVRGARIELLDPIELKANHAEIVVSPDSEALLTALLAVLLGLPEGRRLRIEGHTDNRGDPGTSRRLGAARAASVAKWLVDHGVDAKRISSEGVGPDRPVATNETAVGRAQNRRLEFHLDP